LKKTDDQYVGSFFFWNSKIQSKNFIIHIMRGTVPVNDRKAEKSIIQIARQVAAIISDRHSSLAASMIARARCMIVVEISWQL
jgi:hypothetical protein